MYAVIETGGKQVRAQAGEFIQIEKLTGEVGTKVTFDKVLFVSDPNAQATIGQPYVANAKVEAEIVAQGRGDKVVIIKMKRRKQYRRTQGHRQEQTQLLITGLTDGASLKSEMSAAEKKAKLAQFFTNLKPKGLAKTPKTLGSRKKMKEAAATAAKGKTSKKKA